VPGKPAETARNFILENRDLFGARSLKVNFKTIKSSQKNGRRYERFQQTYNGLPVFAAEVIVQLNELDGVEYVLSDISRDTKALDDGVLSTDPTVSNKEAIKIVRGLIAEEYPDIAIVVTTPLLTVYGPPVVGDAGPVRLVWEMKALSEDEAYAIKIDKRVLIDAHSGEKVVEDRLIHQDLHRHIRDADNETRIGEMVREEDDDEDPSGIVDADNAWDFAEDTYNFYFTEHGRDSWDDDGHVIKITVRYCPLGEPCPWEGASWNDTRNRMRFGEGFTVDDVIGHEFTHAVTDRTSNLYGKNQAGSIQESFSDMWGEFIDQRNGVDGPGTQVRWEIGEDSPWTAIRDMQHPPSINSSLGTPPDHMSDPNFYTGSDDDGGEHHNCGVGNKLAYLLTDGDIFNGQTVTGMGISQVADLYYEVQLHLLPRGASYYDLGNALEHAAVNLGWNQQDRGNLYKAQLAVEIESRRWIYIDRASDCEEPTGRPECVWWEYPYWEYREGPYHSINQALNYSRPGDIWHVRPGLYNESVIIDSMIEINNWGEGSVTIIGE
jgi:Zn-dependent metalloprotease